MFRKQDIAVGKYYVNNARMAARKVMETGGMTVKSSTCHLDTGNSCGSSSECASRDFKRWVDREATPAETVRLKHRK